MSKWKKALKDIGFSAIVYVSTFGAGMGGGSGLFSSATGNKGRKTAKGVYDNYTGHYGRQQKRLAEGQKKEDIIEQQEQRKYALAQRKVMIDEQRERMGVGGRKFNTSTRFETKGKAAKRETLG